MVSSAQGSSKIRLPFQARKRLPAQPAAAVSRLVSGAVDVLFLEEEVDLYIKTDSHEAYVFHGKHIDYGAIDHLVFRHEERRIAVYLKNGSILDLGVRVEYLVRQPLRHASKVYIVRTEMNVSKDGIEVPFIVEGFSHQPDPHGGLVASSE